jgi:hypothetical protein
VKIVKDDLDPDISASEPIDYHDVAKVITKSVSTCIGVYVGADILRRVVIYVVSAKI